jgi:photosystem II stability/assembly factor-like uncharacterized protein
LFLVLIFNQCRKKTPLNIVEIGLDTLTKQNLQNVYFINKDTGFVLGGYRWNTSFILTTFDGGNTWKKTDSLSPWGLTGLTMNVKREIYASGVTGKILFSTNYAQTWQTIQMPDWIDLQRILFLGDSVGIAVGGSADGKGVIQRKSVETYYNWQPTYFDRILNDVFFVNNHVGYVAAVGAIYKTTDAGRNWEILSAKGDNFTAIHFFDELHGLAAGYQGSLLETRNGGKTWTNKRNGNNPFNADWQFYDMKFINPNTGYMAGANGLLLKTTDGGNHWSRSSFFTQNNVRKIFIQSANLIWLAADGGKLFQVKE